MLKLPKNRNDVDSKRRTHPIRIGVIILILTITIADLVLIAEIPFFVSNLQTVGKNNVPGQALPHKHKEPNKLEGSVKGDKTPLMEAANGPVYLLDRSRRHDHQLVK